MSNHPVFSDDMREIVESFVVETQEIFDDLNNDLLRLEHAEDTLPIIDKIFRAVHTVKGTSGFLSLEQLNLLAHRFEDVLNRLRRGEVTFHPGMMDVMFAAFDLMNVLLQQVLDSTIEPVPMEGLLDDLEQLAREGFPDGYEFETDAGPWSPALPQLREQLATHDDASPNHSQHVPKSDDGTRRSRGSDHVRVSVERLDELLSLVGELVLSRNRIARIVSDLHNHPVERERLSELGEASSQLDATTSQLQSAVMQTRMVPIGRAFSRFQRVVRDLAKELGKDVELVLEGTDTELDKSIVDEIGDPLLHLIRNAVDHGIESPAERRRLGKPECGRVYLRAAHDGSHIVITMEDDGSGIDSEALRRRAVGRGFADKQEADAMSTEDLTALIFRPGFSTNDEATRISGRGVGLDVVKTAVNRLGGDVLVQFEQGRGTRFSLRLPLTLAILQCLLVDCSEETYAIPLHAVSEVVAVTNVSTVRGRPVIRLRDEVVPLVDVADTFGLPAHVRRHGFAAVVTIDGERFALVVDRLRGQEEIVIKPLTPYLSAIRGFSGSTILGDGHVVMVLDVGDVIRMEIEQRRVSSNEAA